MIDKSKYPSVYHYNSAAEDENRERPLSVRYLCQFIINKIPEPMPWEQWTAEYCWRQATIVHEVTLERNMQDGYYVNRSFYCEEHAKEEIERRRKSKETVWIGEWRKLPAGR